MTDEPRDPEPVDPTGGDAALGEDGAVGYRGVTACHAVGIS